ncbi:chitinase 1 precursor [Cordyceps javanica]|nr:chitinase 1 precursor [Cordyceps javanica]
MHKWWLPLLTLRLLPLATGTGLVNAVYFANWWVLKGRSGIRGSPLHRGIYLRNFQPNDLPVSNLTHVYYAFMNYGTDGTLFSWDAYADTEKHYPEDSWNDQGTNVYGCVKQLFQIKKQNRHIKLMLSIGGWTLSDNLPQVASSVSARKNFAQSAVSFMQNWGFDGIDLDWEYPKDQTDGINLTYLLQELRKELDSYAAQHASGHHFLLTMAASANPDVIKLLDIKGINGAVDYINLMAYDYAGAWDSYTGYLANIGSSSAQPTATHFATETALNLYLNRGATASKIVLGMPAYGRSFQQTDGIGKPFKGTGPGSWEDGVWDYKALPRTSDARVSCDESVYGCYSYDPNTKELITYDTHEMVALKVAWLRNKGLAGSMFWEASGDRKDGRSLIAASRSALGGLDDTCNFLSYPASKYDNIKPGQPVT